MLDRGFDGRTSAIAYGSRLVFDALGLWPDIAPDAEPIREIRIADDNSSLFLHYDCRELIPDHDDAMPLGYIVENRVLRRVLLDRPRALPSLTLRADAASPRCTPPIPAPISRSTTARACAQGSSPPRTATIAAAPYGWDLRGRMALSADRHRHDRRARTAACRHCRRAFSARRPVRDPADDRRAGPTGIPRRGRSSIVWTEHADLAPRLLALPEAGFAAELRARFGGFLAGSSRSDRAGPIRWC